MAINLIKGQRVEIESSLSRLVVEMGWKVNPNAEPPYDLDASIFLLGNSGQIEHEADFVFYGSSNRIPALDEHGNQLYDRDGNPITRPISLDKSTLGSIDDIGEDEDDTGEGNEEIEVDLTKTSDSVKEILFTVSIYWDPSNSNDPRRKYNFGQVRDAYIQIKNAVTGEVICRYDLDEDFSTDKGVEFGRLYRRGSEWKFQAVGEAHADGLEPICRKYASKYM
ncbi:MAG: TerD family protein [Prevotellaceae bacterium]|nr:TerD family protein [Prevotellaceae bacterium]